MPSQAKPPQKLTSAQQALAADPESLKLVETIASIMAKKLPHAAGDLHSAGLVGLVNAAARFEPDRGVKFQTFAQQHIRGAIIDWTRDMDLRGFGRRNCLARREGRARPQLLSLDYSVQSQVSGRYANWASRESKLANIMIDPGPPPEERVIQADSAHNLLRCLPNRHRLIAERYFLGGVTLKRIGEQIGLSESRCSQMLKQARGWLAEAATDPRFRDTEAA